MSLLAYLGEIEPEVQSGDGIDSKSSNRPRTSNNGFGGNPFFRGFINATMICIPVWTVIIGLFVWLF